MSQSANAQLPGGKWVQRYATEAIGPPAAPPPDPPEGPRAAPPMGGQDVPRLVLSQKKLNDAHARWKLEQLRQRQRRDVCTAVVALLLLCQVLGAAGWLPWTPGLLIHGGIDRLIDDAIARGWRIGAWLKLALDVLFSLYWLLLLLACSRLARDEMPAIDPTRERRRWVMTQSWVVCLIPLMVLLALHALGSAVASTGWWLLALPFELGGHVGMAALLYLLLVPEARGALLIIEDVGMKGLHSRLHMVAGRSRSGRLWRLVRHDHLFAAEPLSPLWLRLLGLASIRLDYFDEQNCQSVITLHAIGPTKQVAEAVSYLNSAFKDGPVIVTGLPPRIPGAPQTSRRLPPLQS